ncbi:hypothetical protein IFM89_009812 [Coptis chinensis]|uniref:Histone chaperone domain-containing protein n=1 Tax=Coptis chinensis TaxID=261450 RepID=A0A835HZA9_9MAGN|nr:hypothetical protein IFM89_009812 [Coptis chinensis]
MIGLRRLGPELHQGVVCAESAEHLMWDCPLVRQLWSWGAGVFEMEEGILNAYQLETNTLGGWRTLVSSLTLEGVRRLIEKDLGMEEYALDAHKRFIKQCLAECFDASSNENVSKSSGETGEEIVRSTEAETTEFSEKLKPDKELKQAEDKEDMQGSPVLGLLDGDDAPTDIDKRQRVRNEKALSEDTIKKAIKKRASYFRANSETISLVAARRLLEEDLKLEKNALDPYKKFISEQLDKELQSLGVAEPENGYKNKHVNKESHRKKDDAEDEVKPKKKIVSKEKVQNSEGLKNSKGLAKETTKSSNKRKRPVESKSEDSSDANDGGDLSEDGRSQSSVEEPVKKKREASTQVHGKNVEHLKSVIRSCGMSIPPSVYKRAKQAPENKREACLIKELEEMLRREGLSSNPSEKEIKEVKKQKQRTKELEGIDLSNIVSKVEDESDSE